MRRSKLLLCFIIIIPFVATAWAYAGTITVNSTDDTNARDTVVTLREAIMLSEGDLLYGDLTVDEQNQVSTPVGSGTSDTIDFIISGTISPGSALPDITDDGTIVDASSQWDGTWPGGQPGITLDGNSAGEGAEGLIISGASNCHIQGLLIANFLGKGILVLSGAQSNVIGGVGTGYRNIISGNGESGVEIRNPGTDSNVVSGNYIGTDVNGTAPLGNSAAGIWIYGEAQFNTIGGTTEGERNIISGNVYSGVVITGSGTDNNVVSGNYIGTDVSGIADLGNLWSGIHIKEGAQSNTIGGSIPGERNIISGNDWNGIGIYNAGTDNNIVSGNYIGTDTNGLTAVGNGTSGVSITDGAQSNIIGGTTEGERNIISGNDYCGVEIYGTGTDNNTISGNHIGTDVTGTTALGNWEQGVVIDNGAQSNTIGGSTFDERNIISGNGANGVAIWNSGTNSNVVSGNYIGIDANGTAAIGNSGSGVRIVFGQLNTIGGTTEGERNIISGNTSNGVSIRGIETKDNRILGNYIGTDVNGTTDLGNLGNGVHIWDSAQSNIVGGTTDMGRNVISGNGSSGVLITGLESDNNIVLGNYIGTDANGTADLGNSNDGVHIDSGAQANTIGGTTAEHRNTISGNDGEGVEIRDLGSNGNVVSGNYIGTDISGTADIGNSANGVNVHDGAQSNIIGGTGNTIAFNGDNGILVSDSDTDYNKISHNSMHDNTGLGIDLVDGGNDEIPVPTITSAALRRNTLDVEGTGAGADATVEIFEADSLASGEGMTYLGSLTADGSGNFSGDIDVRRKGLSVGDPVVATTTHTDNNTSEFSLPVEVEGRCPARDALSSDESGLDTLTAFRDNVLTQNETGQWFIDAYYNHASEMVEILLGNPDLCMRSAAILGQLMPGIQFLLGDKRNGRDIVVTRLLVNRTQKLLADVSEESSDDLADTLSKLSEMLDDCGGKRISRIWESL